jgi:alpha-L-fucosidase
LTGWFSRAGFGLFVHWDHASQQGLEVSWPLVGGLFALPHCQAVPVEQYHSSAATFDPQRWDAGQLAALARAAGMGYGVLTAKHHSGYAMWPSKLTPFSVEHSPFGRDIVGEFVEAFRAAGLRVGLYYSLSDWSHLDYPPFREADKPYLPGLSPPLPAEASWSSYLDYLFGQVEELLTNYGTIDVLWFDGQWERTPDRWRASELAALARSLQPGLLINDRLPGCGDFETPEQFIPPQAPAVAWETCLTMNESWGYNPDDHDYKSARTLVHSLCEVRARGGNLLLNVSPTGDGTLPSEQRERLAIVARWMDRHHDAIIDVSPGLEPWQFYGPTTRRGERVYLHLLMQPYEAVVVRGVHVNRVRSVVCLGTGATLEHSTRAGVLAALSADPVGELRIEVPGDAVDDLATVLAVDFEGGP